MSLVSFFRIYTLFICFLFASYLLFNCPTRVIVTGVLLPHVFLVHTALRRDVCMRVQFSIVK